jgi:hypothetical protein
MALGIGWVIPLGTDTRREPGEENPTPPVSLRACSASLQAVTRYCPQIAPKKRSPMGSAHGKRVGPPHELLRRPAPQRVPGVSRPRNVAPEGPGARSESITPARNRVSIIPRCGHGVRLTDVPICPGSGIVLPRGNEGNGVSSLSRSLTSGVFLSTLASAFVSSTTWRSSRIEANWRVGRPPAPPKIADAPLHKTSQRAVKLSARSLARRSGPARLGISGSAYMDIERVRGTRGTRHQPRGYLEYGHQDLRHFVGSLAPTRPDREVDAMYPPAQAHVIPICAPGRADAPTAGLSVQKR